MLRNKLQWNFNHSTKLSIHENASENIVCEKAAILSRGEEFYSLWPSDVIWQWGSRSTLAQVMACCLMASSLYLNQCWPIISEVMWHPPDSNFQKILKILIVEMSLKFTNFRLQSNPPGASELRYSRWWMMLQQIVAVILLAHPDRNRCRLVLRVLIEKSIMIPTG